MKTTANPEVVPIEKLAGGFAEDKDVARNIRQESILPRLAAGKNIVLNFEGVSVATQSFIHAMISEALRIHNGRALKLLEFKSCNSTVKSVVLTVIEYSLSPQTAGQNKP
jgi:hypothetical protein